MNLKPCPFCGGEPKIKTQGQWKRVACSNIPCDCQPKTMWHYIQSTAVKAWNKRSA